MATKAKSVRFNLNYSQWTFTRNKSKNDKHPIRLTHDYRAYHFTPSQIRKMAEFLNETIEELDIGEECAGMGATCLIEEEVA